MMIGPVIPVIVPEVVTDAIETVTVDTDEDQTTFQISFRLGKRSPLVTLFMITGGVPLPLRVVLIATLNGIPQVLVDGLVTNQQVSPGSDGGDATLTLTGSDLSAAMDLLELTGFPFAAMPVEVQIELILAKYAILGIVPMVIPTGFLDVPLPTEKIPTQTGTDLCYIRDCAEWAGYAFHMLMPAPMVNIAYWGPKMRIGVPQSALNIDMDAYTNVESIHFGFENRDRKQPVLSAQVPETTVWVPVPIPEISILNPPLGLIQPLPSNIQFISDVGGLTPIEVAQWGLATVANSLDSTTAEGTLNVMRYGGILQPRSLVGVRGAGSAFDGLYFARKVGHQIKRGEYTQSFSLVRNGLISTVPMVPV
jgi:hypothetical protein